MVDLTRTSREILTRYMSTEQAQNFLAWHDILPSRRVGALQQYDQ